MYDLPALQPANDRFWRSIRQNLGYGPEKLSRGIDDWEVWQHADLVFAQTCGMPYRNFLHGKVQLVGTPDYGLSGCPPGYYRSVFVARKGDPRGLEDLVKGTFAFNDSMSQSGWAAPTVFLARRHLSLSAAVKTGGHALSAQAVAYGTADFAALDALTWELLKEHTTLGEDLRAVEATEPTLALPYITSLGQDAQRVALSVQSAINMLSDQDRALLHVRDLISVPADAYLSVPNPPQTAVDLLNP